uniref:mechanosensitive ion channel protein 6-like n=1 Tax=Erigeron canadensis TaxID=72917 RepID=UPI001CB8CC6A|nr:mechanosensitive ion channel protein 6-like [Erigeron canadensis]
MEDLERSSSQVQLEEEQDMFSFDSARFGMSSSIPESPNYDDSQMEVMVSSNEAMISDPQMVRQRSNASIHSGVMGHSGEKVVVCSSNASFKRKSTLMRTKTKSRLMDQPDMDQRSHKTPGLSGIHGKHARELEEDEFSIEDDMPDEYKTWNYNKWTSLQIISFILIMGALAYTLSTPKLRNENCYDLQLWRWEVMILVVISGRVVSGWGITILVFFMERSSFLRKRLLYFVYGLKKQVQNCIWLTLGLIAWKCTFDKKVESLAHAKVLRYVNKTCICLLVGNIFWLVKTLLIRVLASSFHVNKFFDRIQDSIFYQYVIETLSGPPVIEIQLKQEEGDRLIEEVEKFQRVGMSIPAQLKANILKGFEGIRTPTSNTPVDGKKENSSQKNDNMISIDHLHKLNQKNISAWNMYRMMNIINKKMLATSDKQLQDETFIQITNEKEAKIAAKNIFSNVAKPGSGHIYLEDLMRFLAEDEALKIIRLLDDASETKGISKRALKTWMVNVFKERRSLALSLYDTKTAVDNLQQILNVVVGIILTVMWIIILKFATTQFFIFLSSQLVLVAFVFGNTCKTLFEAIVFVFVVHPYDVGDRCEIDGVQMIVEEVNILTTIFLRYDNQKIAYPNSVLSTKPIANYHRSPDMGDAIDFCIHVSTPTEKIAKMKEMITIYVEAKSEHWQPEPMIVLRDVEDMNRLKISIWVSHRMNFQDMGERWIRRASLVEEIIKIFKNLDIEYRMLPLDINVRNIPGLMASNRFPSNWTTCAN